MASWGATSASRWKSGLPSRRPGGSACISSGSIKAGYVKSSINRTLSLCSSLSSGSLVVFTERSRGSRRGQGVIPCCVGANYVLKAVMGELVTSVTGGLARAERLESSPADSACLTAASLLLWTTLLVVPSLVVKPGIKRTNVLPVYLPVYAIIGVARHAFEEERNEHFIGP